MEKVNRTNVIVCVTSGTADLAKSFRTILQGAGEVALVHGKEGTDGVDQVFSDSILHIRSLFAEGKNVIAICASGIVIRAVAPLLDSKFDEPAVLSVSRDGASVVPLLGGHHGSNDLARLIAEGMKSHAAVTTAGDCKFSMAIDHPPKGWKLQNARAAGPLMARMVNGEAVSVAEGLDWVKKDKLTLADDAAIRLENSVEKASGADALVYSAQKLVLGVGCERGVAAEHLIDHITKVLDDNNLAVEALGLIASIDVKMDEAAIHAAAKHFGVPARFFPASELEAQKDRLANPSDVVYSEVGCHGVAEGAALAAVGACGSLLVEKVKSDKATCAVGMAVAPFVGDLPGKARGRLSVVGIGPGQSEWRTPEATNRIAEAEELVGYGFYIDLLGPLGEGKSRSDFPLGGEEDRCRYALEQAGKGKNVALICSGDAGIYAMGALVMELLDREADNGGVSDDAKRVELINVPGISALQAASVRFGAILGHDFCTVSLSDLLTPWETIEQRLEAVALGDFVVAFYNPVSMKRRTQLARAKEILLTKRPPETPVLLASSLGRPQENLRIRTLGELEVDEVDMMTVVLVGSSQSRILQNGDRSVGDNGWMAYTPRGYAKRIDADKE
ncbi:precorrin-3B C(17)-methyltransferase [Cohaesibacter sp. CAU 1516]|uniref:precorrin-3B C(17)-methyltransferase n=1 Tax=Cohaesibacter sp. CAU 1516 TaxID=2576038 RepID=UPI0010FE0CAC|nr:precorrin-3B C(17)-methyltransferase [Cohaesibacter sp. CAU 1516]TLP49265.1 precorrin-3B C(17)-methyltransferase [Cohaesibacter sp. CAU 1516]